MHSSALTEADSTGAASGVKSETKTIYYLFCINYSSSQKNGSPRLDWRAAKTGIHPDLENHSRGLWGLREQCLTHSPGSSAAIRRPLVVTQQGRNWWVSGCVARASALSCQSPRQLRTQSFWGLRRKLRAAKFLTSLKNSEALLCFGACSDPTVVPPPPPPTPRSQVCDLRRGF